MGRHIQSWRLFCLLPSLLWLCSRVNAHVKQRTCSRNMDFILQASQPQEKMPGDKFNLTINIPKAKSICSSKGIKGKKGLDCVIKILAPDGAVFHSKYGGGTLETYQLDNKTYTSQIEWYPLPSLNQKKFHPSSQYDTYTVEFSVDVCAPPSSLDFSVSVMATRTKGRKKRTETCKKTIKTKVRIYS